MNMVLQKDPEMKAICNAVQDQDWRHPNFFLLQTFHSWRLMVRNFDKEIQIYQSIAQIIWIVDFI